MGSKPALRDWERSVAAPVWNLKAYQIISTPLCIKLHTK
jgi:hypothetical protein